MEDHAGNASLGGVAVSGAGEGVTAPPRLGDRLAPSRVARSLAAVGAGTAAGQLVIVVSAPVLSRLYDPESFGLLSVWAAVLSVLVAVVSLRYDFAIPLSDDDSEALHLLVLSFVGVGVASAAVALLVLLAGPQLAAAARVGAIVPYLWLFPIALAAAGVSQAVSSWATYRRLYPALGRLRAVQGVGQVVAQTAFGLARFGPVGLLGGDAAGRFLGTEQLLRSLVRAARSVRISLVALRHVAAKRWSFARVMTMASFFSALSLQVPFLLIPTLFDLDSSGQYFLAYRVLVLPASLVSAAVSQVFFGEASSRRADDAGLHELAHRVAVALFVFSIPTYALIAAAGPPLFETVFGHRWGLAGVCAVIVAPSLIFWSVASPISSLPLVGRRERESLAFTAAELAIKTASLAVGAALGSLTAALAILSLTSIALYVAALWRFLRVATVHLGELVRPALTVAVCTLPFAAVTLVVSVTLGGPATVVACGVGWLGAIALAARTSPETRALLVHGDD